VNATTLTATIRKCTEPTELYRHYAGQTDPQGAHIALDLETGAMWADYNAEVGNGRPEDVYHGRTRRYGIPLLTGDAANALMAELLPLAQRVLNGSDIDWNDRGNKVATLNDDAAAAEAEIDARLGNDGVGPVDAYFTPDQLVGVWDIDGAVNGQEISEHGITPATTDERLGEIEQQILTDLAGCGEHTVAVCPGLNEYLRGLRKQTTETYQDVYWSVMRGESPDSQAVQPEPAGITIPDEILTWATGHGLSVDDPDVYLLIAPQDDAEDMQGEIAFTEGRLTVEDAAALYMALAEQEQERADRTTDHNTL
jgi:hypothetical protein